MNDIAVPPELDQPLPRHVKMSGVLAFAFGAIAFLLAGIWLFSAVIGYVAVRDEDVLRMRGVAIEGKVIQLNVQRKRSKAYYQAQYQFELKDAAGNVIRRSGWGNIDERLYHILQVNKDAPILYDPLNPGVSSLNFDDRVYRRVSFEYFIGLICMGALVLGGVYVLFASPFLFFYWREKRLVSWGKIASASILREEVTEFRGLKTSTVYYQFTDSDGNMAYGKRKYVPLESDTQSNSERAAVMRHPLVLYDAKKSARNLLYPPLHLKCVKP